MSLEVNNRRGDWVSLLHGRETYLAELRPTYPEIRIPMAQFHGAPRIEPWAPGITKNTQGRSLVVLARYANSRCLPPHTAPWRCVCFLFSSALLRVCKKGVHLIHSHVPVSSPKCGPKEVFLIFLFSEFMDRHLMLCLFSDQLSPCACFYQADSQMVPLLPLLFQVFFSPITLDCTWPVMIFSTSSPFWPFGFSVCH